MVVSESSQVQNLRVRRSFLEGLSEISDTHLVTLNVGVDLAALYEKVCVVGLLFQSAVHVVQGLFVVLLQTVRLTDAAKHTCA